jgi:Restriction Enzyme Adenine Methylase Associated
VLRFKRPRIGQTHKSAVTADGALSLDGGQVFRSPSRAAAVAADMPAVDGWHAWVVVSSGRSLDSLRQELLYQVAAGSAGNVVAAESATPGAQDRYGWLKEARVRADAKHPVEIAVRDLLARWGCQSAWCKDQSADRS